MTMKYNLKNIYVLLAAPLTVVSFLWLVFHKPYKCSRANLTAMSPLRSIDIHGHLMRVQKDAQNVVISVQNEENNSANYNKKTTTVTTKEKL